MAWTITYSDGAANHYEFNIGGFEYRPVTPEQSSTGTYSGGPPRRRIMNGTEITELLKRVHALEAATDIHVADRMKGSGAFTITNNRGTSSFIVKRCELLAQFDAFLAAL